MIRTFVAVEISQQVRDKASLLIERLGAGGGNIKWVEKQNLHLTLNFLGDVNELLINDVCRAVARAVEEIQPFEIQCCGTGAFPDIDRPRTVWLGVGQGNEAMCQLQTATEQALAELGYPKEGRKFHPHLTLGRQRRSRGDDGNLGELLKQHADFDAGTMEVSQVVVFSSRFERGALTYEVLSRVPLKDL